jgi:hypothetical protein
MNSDLIIAKLKIKFGESLEDLSIEDRYAAIALLALAIQKQIYVFQVSVISKELDEVYRKCQATEVIYDIHVTTMPRVLKFFAETIPEIS